LATLIAFRFGTCYFGSFGLALVMGLIPVILAGIGIDGPRSAVRGLIQLMRPPIEQIGTRLLGLHVEGTQVGGDSAFQWTALFCIAVLSAWATLVWTLLDLWRRRYDRLQTWVWTVLRLLLAAAMFYFGMAKSRRRCLSCSIDWSSRTATTAPRARSGRRSASPSRIKCCSGRRKCLVASCYCCLG
jgi:hypothetical protein